MSYIGRQPTYGLFEKQSILGNGSAVQFTLNYAVSTSGSLLVNKNGTILEPDVGYTVNYDKIIFSTPPAVIDNVYVIFLGRQTLVPYTFGSQVTKDSFVGNGTTQNFTTSTSIVIPQAVLVFVDGIQQSYGTNFTTLGSQVIFSSAPLINAAIDVINMGTTAQTINTVTNGSITWDKLGSDISGVVGVWTMINSNTTAVAGSWYMIDTSAGPVTLTLPATPTFSNTIRIMDMASSFAANNLTIDRNGNKIMGVSQDMSVATNNASLGLVYSNAANGWRILEV